MLSQQGMAVRMLHSSHPDDDPASFQVCRCCRVRFASGAGCAVVKASGSYDLAGIPDAGGRGSGFVFRVGVCLELAWDGSQVEAAEAVTALVNAAFLSLWRV